MERKIPIRDFTSGDSPSRNDSYTSLLRFFVTPFLEALIALQNEMWKTISAFVSSFGIYSVSALIEKSISLKLPRSTEIVWKLVFDFWCGRTLKIRFSFTHARFCNLKIMLVGFLLLISLTSLQGGQNHGDTARKWSDCKRTPRIFIKERDDEPGGRKRRFHCWWPLHRLPWAGKRILLEVESSQVMLYLDRICNISILLYFILNNSVQLIFQVGGTPS